MDNSELHHSEYPKLIVISILPILFLSLSSHINASTEGNIINILSPSNNSQVHLGNLTITGTAVYDSSLPCSVYATWNDSQSIRYPANIINNGKNYSMWKFTFDPESHEVVAGPNTLNAILSCVNLPSDNLTTVSSIKVNGIEKSEKENNSSKIGSEFSDLVPTTNLSNSQEKSDVFSSNNFELAIPFTKENETKYGSPIINEFERVNRTDTNRTIQVNRTITNAEPPSILEIESNQNSNKFLPYSNETRVVGDAGPEAHYQVVSSRKEETCCSCNGEPVRPHCFRFSNGNCYREFRCITKPVKTGSGPKKFINFRIMMDNRR